MRDIAPLEPLHEPGGLLARKGQPPAPEAGRGLRRLGGAPVTGVTVHVKDNVANLRHAGAREIVPDVDVVAAATAHLVGDGLRTG